MEECHLLLTDQVDLVNPEGHRVVPNVRKPLPLGGPPGQADNYYDFGLEELVPSLWIESERDYDISAAYDSQCHQSQDNIQIRLHLLERDFKNLHPNDLKICICFIFKASSTICLDLTIQRSQHVD
ncbi:hypothetical protein Tco_1423498 [Tanacetum coccineum]